MKIALTFGSVQTPSKNPVLEFQILNNTGISVVSENILEVIVLTPSMNRNITLFLYIVKKYVRENCPETSKQVRV